MRKNDITKVAEIWGKGAPDMPKGFYGFPPIRDYLFTCVSGKIEKTEQNWCERWTIETYLNDKIPIAECLSLGCGFGHIERILADLGAFLRCTAIDLSPGAIRKAKVRAKKLGYDNIDYRQADLNVIELESEKYDLIWGNAVLHHISNLEYLVEQIHKALKPGGIFVCNEPIGNKWGHLPFREREIINSVIHLIPARYRLCNEDTFIPVWFRFSAWRRLLFRFYILFTFQASEKRVNTFRPKSDVQKYKIWLFRLYETISRMVPTIGKTSFRYGKVWDQDSKLVKLSDPSEGVRTDEIIPILRNKFSEIDIRYYNGVILSKAFDRKFYEEYDRNRKEDRALLNLLINIEKTMIDIGEISSDHAHIIAKKQHI